MFNMLGLSSLRIRPSACRFVLPCTLIVTLAVGCPSPPAPQLSPDFQASATRGTGPLTVTFTNTSSASKGGATTETTSTNFSPSAEKAPPRTVDIRPGAQLDQVDARFVLDVQGEVAVGSNVSATNTSVNDISSNWEIAFISGPSRQVISQQSARNMVEVPMDQAGMYEITLTVEGASGQTDTKIDTLLAESRVRSNETASYTWDFGDASGTMTLSTPSDVAHEYATPGTYTVSLTMNRAGESATETKTDYVQVFSVPVVDFSANETQVEAPATLTFTDASTAAAPDQITQRVWNFGDGTPAMTTADTSITHEYTAAGVYDISLEVTTQFGGVASTTRTALVTVFEGNSDTTPGTGDPLFALSNYLPMTVGNRWVYRSTGSNSPLSFHFSIEVIGESQQTTSTGETITFSEVVFADSLNRNNTDFLAVVNGVLYSFADSVAVDNYVVEGFLEPFFVFPLLSADLSPRPSEIFDPEIGFLPVTYEAGSLFSFIPRMLTESTLQTILDLFSPPPSSTENAKQNDDPQARGRDATKQPTETSKGFPFVTGDLFGLGDQPASIGITLRNTIIASPPVPYVLSEDIGLTFLTGPLLTTEFPAHTIGPGTSFSATPSSFTLNSALLSGVFQGRDDHADLVDSATVPLEGAAFGTPPTRLHANFGPLSAYLAVGDTDTFYLPVGFASMEVPYQLTLSPATAPVTLSLFEYTDSDPLAQVPYTVGDEFEQSLSFSEFIVSLTPNDPNQTVDVKIELNSVDLDGEDIGSASAFIVDAQPWPSYIDRFGDLDVFAFDTQAGQTYTIQTTSETLTATDTVLDIRDASNKVLAFDDDGGFDLNSLIEFTAPATQTYYAVVGGYEDIVVGPYLISITTGADLHSNSFSDATPLSASGAPVAGSLTLDDIDWFRFNAIAGTSYTIETAGGTDTYLSLRRAPAASEDELAFNDDIDEAGLNFNSRIIYTPTVTEELFVLLEGFNFRTIGPYTLSILEELP